MKMACQFVQDSVISVKILCNKVADVASEARKFYDELSIGTVSWRSKYCPPVFRTIHHIFFLFDSIALFISLAVVVVQTSVVVIENRVKKQLMSIINKLMWMACTLVLVALLALSYIVVGENEKWLAVGETNFRSNYNGYNVGDNVLLDCKTVD
ncbi:hypothetical protein OIU78_017746 [Salix suchowensis]|nr:hypothetical protein OIU78_017746 [Salix suchowensis]